jgi:hypothetical protein
MPNAGGQSFRSSPLPSTTFQYPLPTVRFTLLTALCPLPTRTVHDESLQHPWIQQLLTLRLLVKK